MLSEREIRKLKSEYLDVIRYSNEEIARKVAEIEEQKKHIKSAQDKIDIINKVLGDGNGT